MNGRTQSGRGVANSLGKATQQVKRHLGECQASLRKLDQSMEHVLNQRGEALLDLARHYLPDMTRESVLNTFQDLRKDLLNVLARKQHSKEKVSQELRELEQENVRLQAELESANEEFHELAEERAGLESVVADRLRENKEFVELSQEALASEQQLERNEERVAEIQAEAKEKLPSYNKSRLFRYLIDRDYGTSAYKKKGWTKRLDSWVAKLIDFPSAKRGYDFLCVTPELMAAEVTRRREQFNALMDRVEAMEDQVADEVGLTDVMRKGLELGRTRDRFVGEIDDNEKLFSKLHKVLLGLDGTQNEFYDQGVHKMKAYLSQMEQSWLEQFSQQTPDRKDDQLVAEIGWQNERFDGAQRESESLGREQRTWDDRAAGLSDILQRFRQAGFDTPRSQFAAGFNIERLAEDFLSGRIGREEFWSSIRQHQQFLHPWQEKRSRNADDKWGAPDMSSVLGHVLAEVAGEALRQVVRNGMRRRREFRNKVRRHNGRPPFNSSGF